MIVKVFGLKQEKLIHKNLKVDDAFILSVIEDMICSNSFDSIIIDGKRFVHINQTYLWEETPIVGTKRTLQKKLKMYEEMGIIERQVFNQKGLERGTFSYIHLTKKFEKLK